MKSRWLVWEGMKPAHFPLFFSSFLFLFITKMIDAISKPFFNFVLPRVVNTGILTTSLLLYTQRNQRLVWLGALFGLFMQMFLASFTWSQVFCQFLETNQTALHFLLSIVLTVSTTALGMAMSRHKQPKRPNFITRPALFVVPFCYILNQGLDINLYCIHNASVCKKKKKKKN